MLRPSLVALVLKCGTHVIHAISYARSYQNKRFHVPEMNVCVLTSSELTNVLTVDDPVVFSILSSPLWLCPQCGADCAHWCNLQSQFPEYICCPSLGGRIEQTLSTHHFPLHLWKETWAQRQAGSCEAPQEVP